MISSKTFVKLITTAQMAWLVKTKKVWQVEGHGEDIWFSHNYVYVATPAYMNNDGTIVPEGFEVHK